MKDYIDDMKNESFSTETFDLTLLGFNGIACFCTIVMLNSIACFQNPAFEKIFNRIKT